MNKLVLLPVFVQLALTFVLLFWMGRARFAAVRNKQVKIKDIALGQNAWTPPVAQIGRSFQNQFEMPMLFYVLVVFVLVTGVASTAFVVLEWLFVVSRIAHSVVHVTTNNITYRFTFYLIGVAFLMLAWIWFAARIFGLI